MRGLLRIVLMLLIAVCVFDPADKLLGLKTPLFIVAWGVFLLSIKSIHISVSRGLVKYLILFLLIPLISIAGYFMAGGNSANYDGFQYLKSYLFVTITLILYFSKIDLIKPAAAIITSLSMLALIILISSYLNISPVVNICAEIGYRYEILTVGGRNWGASVLPDLPGVYFHTAELMVFPIGYFTMKTLFTRGGAKARYALLLAVNMVAMFFSATRNNIAVCILVPIFITAWYSRRKIFIVGGIIILMSMLYVNGIDMIRESVLSPDTPSNQWKISMLEDYFRLFSDAKVLFFGQGLGSYFESTMRGPVSVTELTYFEFIRRFGLILALASFALFLYPLSKLRMREYRSLHYLFIIYAFFLMMSFFNPLLMSSSGMLLFSIILYKTFSPVLPSVAGAAAPEGNRENTEQIRGFQSPRERCGPASQAPSPAGAS